MISSVSEYLTILQSLRECQSELSIGWTGTVHDSMEWGWSAWECGEENEPTI